MDRQPTTIRLGPGLGRHPSRAAPLADLDDQVAPVPFATLNEALAHWAAAAPERALVHFIDYEEGLISRTCAEVAAASRRAMAALAGQVVRRGDRVLIALDTSPALVEAFLGCCLLGAIPALADPPRLATTAAFADRISARLAVLGARAVVADGRGREALMLVDGGGPGARPPILLTEDDLDTEANLDPAPVSPTDTAFIQFTSGSTSAPKGVVVTHRALLANARGIAQGGRWPASGLTVAWLPLFHDMGLVASLLTSLVHGIPTALMPPMAMLLDPSRWLWAIHHFRGTVSFAPNFAYQLCVKRISERALPGLDLSSWRRAFNAAELVQVGTLRQFAARFAAAQFDARAFVPAYGLAEFTVGASIHDPHEEIAIDTISSSLLHGEGRAVPVDPGERDALSVVGVGPVFPGHEVRVTGPDGEVLGERLQGQLELRGPSLFEGYFEDPGATEQVMIDGWLRTGDLGYLTGGRVFICGRSKELIIKAGSNYHPHWFEQAAEGVAGVRPGCVAAIGIASEGSGTEDLVLFFETAASDPREILALCKVIERRVLGATAIRPDRLVALPPRAMPKTSSGKIQRAALQDHLASRRAGIASPLQTLLDTGEERSLP